MQILSHQVSGLIPIAIPNARLRWQRGLEAPQERLILAQALSQVQSDSGFTGLWIGVQKHRRRGLEPTINEPLCRHKLDLKLLHERFLTFTKLDGALRALLHQPLISVLVGLLAHVR